MKLSQERIEELLAIAEDRLSQREWFDYLDVGMLCFEGDEEMTSEELDWLRKYAVVKVTVELSDDEEITL